MPALDSAPQIHLEDRDSWRRWLAANHAKSTGIWLVRWRRSTGRMGIEYGASVEEALCFGWIDGQAATIDEQRSMQYFAPRRPKSAWSRSNKDRFERLSQAGLVAPVGLAAVERAKADGSWAILDSVDRLEMPTDLAAALDALLPARENWEAFPRSVKSGLLAWIAQARQDQTRKRRIEETATAAQRNQRAHQPRRTTKA
jgi:uncharacterized protein YdeI (YjbR/CyaY-like superfamily)